MPHLQIQCGTCGRRQDADINEIDLEHLKTEGHLVRYCPRCAGSTQWKRRDTPSPFRASETEPLAKRVLLIDDDDNILAVIGKVLRRLNLQLQVASTGRQAAQLLGRNDYDLILSDIRMPELDGQQLFEFLEKTMPEYKQRVIFITGDAHNPATRDFLEAARCPYLTKPIEIPALLELLDRFFAE